MSSDSISRQSRSRHILGDTFASLKHRNFRLYFTGQVISNSGNWLTNIALTLLVLKLTHSGLAVGILAVCQFGPILLLTLWGGTVADRVDKRKLLLVTQSLEMLESIGLAVVAFSPHPSLTALYILAALGGTVLSLDNPLRRAFVSEMVPREDVTNAVIINSTIINMSRIVGPLLAGLLIVSVGYGWCFTVDAVSYLAVLACLLLMNPLKLYHQDKPPRGKGEIRAGLRYVRSQPVLWISLMMLGVIGVLSYNFGVTLPLFVTNGLHKSTTTYTVIYATTSVGSVLTALIIARRKTVRLRHVIIGAAALGVSMFALALSSNVLLAAISAFFVGAASIIYTTSTTALVQLTAEQHMRGRVLALQSVLLIGTTPIGGPLLGWLADHAGGRVPIILGAIVALLMAAIGYTIGKCREKSFQHRATEATS